MCVDKRKIILFVIIFFAVAVGFIVQISAYPENNFLGFDYNSFIYIILYLVTFTYNLILWVMLFAEPLENYFWIAILMQIVKIILLFILFNKMLFSRK